MRRIGRALAYALLVVVASAPAARAAQLVEIRVGVHPGFTRVVFELDTQAGYSIARPTAGDTSDELVVDLAARSLRRVVTSRSDLVETVRVEPGEHGSVARIHLRGPVDVTDTLLVDPARVVIDLRPAPEAPPRTAEAERSEPERPVPLAEPEAEPERAAPSPQETEATPPEPDAGAERDEAAAPEPPDGGITTVAEPQAESETPDPAAPGEEPVFDERAQELAGGETPPGEPTPAPDAGQQRPRTARALEPGRSPQPAQPAPGLSRPEVASPGESGTGLLQDPRLLALGALTLVLLVVFLGLRRRRRGRRSPLADFPPYEEEAREPEEPVVVARSEEELGGLAVPRAEEFGGERPPVAAGRSSIFEPGFDAEPEDDELGRDTGLEPHPEPGLGPESQLAAAAGHRAGPDRRVEELERRVAHLEKRIEEVAEVKDRLDRQLTTQNEELRVQRAAIARTQRVLRNLTQNPDSATEPALKGPGTQPPGGTR